MGRIITSVTVGNAKDASKSLRCDAFVDTGASHMVLPLAWKAKLGPFDFNEEVEVVLANQEIEKAEVCGPVFIQMEGFRNISTEVAFVDMKSHDGFYDPLIGYLVLEQSLAAVDMVGHRLVPVKRFDLK